MPLKGEYILRPIGTDWSFADTHPASEDATVTVPGEEGKKHYITSVLGSFEADNQEGRLEVTCAGDTVFETFITGNPVDFEPGTPIACGENEDIVLTLYNESNNQATVFIAGFTRKA